MKIKEALIHTQDQKIHIPPENYVLMVEQQQHLLRKMVEAVEPCKGMTVPTIKMIPGQLHIVTDEAEDILIASNPGIFQRSGQLVRIITEAAKPGKKPLKDKEEKSPISRSDDALVIIGVDPIYLAETLGKLASWAKLDERTKEWKAKDCPDKIAKTLLVMMQKLAYFITQARRFFRQFLIRQVLKKQSQQRIDCFLYSPNSPLKMKKTKQLPCQVF